MEQRRHKVPEKYLRRRRIFVLVVAVLIIVIVALIAGLKKPKDKDVASNESENSLIEQQDDSGQDEEERNTRIVDETPDENTPDPSGDAQDPAEGDGEEVPDETPDGEEAPVDDLGTSGDELSEVVDTLEGSDPQTMMLGAVKSTPDTSPNPPPARQKAAEDVKPKASSDWKLILVNATNPLPDDFTIETIEVDGHPVDKRIKDPLVKMMLAAKADGINLEVVSGYRSVATQKQVYDKKMNEYLQNGLSREKATLYTEMYIHTPGQSEHHTGLAVDILTPTYTKLLPGYANTAAAKWLKENAAEYGFILRYPEGKEKITGISFEPWHYRYVGTAVAKDIMKKECTLEEYFYFKEKETTKKKATVPQSTGNQDVSPNVP